MISGSTKSSQRIGNVIINTKKGWKSRGIFGVFQNDFVSFIILANTSRKFVGTVWKYELAVPTRLFTVAIDAFQRSPSSDY